MRGRRLAGGCAVAATFVALTAGGGSAQTTAFSYGWNLKPVSDGEKWLRVFVEGTGSIDVVAVRGVDFTITTLESARASGGARPRCGISGSPATLRCDGKLSGGMSLFLNFGVSGAGGTYEIGFSVGGSPLFFQRQTQGPPLAQMQAQLIKSSATTSRIVVIPKQGFTDLEVLPIGFVITKVRSVRVGGRAVKATCAPEGWGVDCKVKLPAGRVGLLEVETANAPRWTASAQEEPGPGADVAGHNEEADPPYTGEEYAPQQEGFADLSVHFTGGPTHLQLRSYPPPPRKAAQVGPTTAGFATFHLEVRNEQRAAIDPVLGVELTLYATTMSGAYPISRQPFSVKWFGCKGDPNSKRKCTIASVSKAVPAHVSVRVEFVWIRGVSSDQLNTELHALIGSGMKTKAEVKAPPPDANPANNGDTFTTKLRG